MAIEFKKASRSRIPVKIEFFGPPGSGKTWSSLMTATTMDCKNICLIDTEQSASLYDEHFDFQVAEIHPDDYKNKQRQFIKDFCKTFEVAVKDLEADCIIIDSLTHLWEAVKDYVSAQGGRYTDWNKGTPLWKEVIKMILSCPVPVIVCSRASYDDVIETKEINGKTSYNVKRLGTKADVRATSDYEFTTVLSIDMNHHFKATKDRTGLFASTMGDDGEPRPLDGTVGKELRAWMKGGKLETTELHVADVDIGQSKVEKKIETVKGKSTTAKKEDWKKTANKYLDAIEACGKHEDILTLASSVQEFIEEGKIPEAAAQKLSDAVVKRTTELEPPY